MQYTQAGAERGGLKMWHFIMEAVITVNSSTPGTRLYLQSPPNPVAFGAEKQNE